METQPWGAARRAARQIINYLRILRGAGPAPPTVIHNKKNLAEGQVLSSGPRLMTRDPRKVYHIFRQYEARLSWRKERLL